MGTVQQSVRRLQEELVAGRRRHLRARRLLKQLARDLGALGQAASCAEPSQGGALCEGLRDARERLEELRVQMTEQRRRGVARAAAALARLRRDLAHAADLSVLGELSASVAHEIRNPLCGILLSAEVLQTKMDPGDSRMVLLGNLQREAEKMERIVNNLLHFSRRYRPRLARCELADVVMKSVESVRHRLRKKQMDVCVRRSGTECEAEVDADLLQQVFSNILANAVDACPPESRIEVTLGPGEAPDSVAVTICDRGEGIPPELLGRIFDPFCTSKANGVGLGLSVTRKIVEAHMGRIDVVSQPGKGATFTVLLPRQPQPQPAEVAA